METLQGVSIPELTSLEGRKWRTAYSDPASTERVGLEDTVWPVVFAQMEQFIKDVNLTPDVLEFGYDMPVNMFANGEAAMISGSSARVSEFRDQGIDTVILPYFVFMPGAPALLSVVPCLPAQTIMIAISHVGIFPNF